LNYPHAIDQNKRAAMVSVNAIFKPQNLDERPIDWRAQKVCHDLRLTLGQFGSALRVFHS
jgi:hypothetical protein